MVKLRAVLHQGQPQQIKGHDWLWQGVTCLIAGSSGGIPVAGVRGGRADARPQLLGEGGWQLRPPPGVGPYFDPSRGLHLAPGPVDARVFSAQATPETPSAWKLPSSCAG